jgi:ribosomal-protein-alanine N-acetyltransferase
MQQIEDTTGTGGVERKRVEAVVETLATLGSRGESVAEVAHDARNMVTALGLYCDLLEEPGVLAVPFTHYGSELRLVAAASRRGVGHVMTIDVLPEARRAGVGSKLLGAAEDRLRAAGCRIVYLETAVDNQAALAFYKRQQYFLVKTVPRYYANGVDALVLEKNLLSAAQAS